MLGIPVRPCRVARGAALVTLLIGAALQATGAQSIVTVRVGAGGVVQVTPGAPVAIPIVIDMTAASGANLASLSTGLSWGASALTFDSIRVAGFGSLTANTSGAAGGNLSANTVSGVGTTSTVTMANAYFTASATSGTTTTLSLAPSAANDQASGNILPLVRIRSLDVCLAPPGNWGDVNGDALVNILDAQQIARFSVALSVTNAPLTAAEGDVSADGIVNIIDAQQIARFSVALSASPRINTVAFTPPVVSTLTVPNVFDAAAGSMNPGTPANLNGFVVGRQAQLRPVARDAGAADVTACATLTYTSSNPAVATVSPSGLVDAIAPGPVTITVASGGVSTTVDFTVTPVVAAVVNSWTNPSGGLWSTAGNWSLGRVPQMSDSVVIAQAGTYSVSLDATFSASFITVGGGSGTQTLTIGGRTLTVGSGGAMTVRSGGALSMTSSTIAGPGMVVNQGTATLSGSTIGGSFDNQGLLVVPPGTSAINGVLTTATTSTIRVQSSGGVGSTALTVATGFTNNGAIELTNVNGGGFVATLTVTAGTLTNAAGGTITSLATGGGARSLAMELNNQGTLTVEQATTLARSSAAHANSGTIAVSGGDLTITQSGATPSFTTTGTVTIASGRTLSVTSGTMTYSGGSIGGAGTWALSGVTLHLTQSFSNGVTALVPASTTINGPGTLTNAAGQTLTLAGVTINAPLHNEGLLLLVPGTIAMNGAVTTATTSTIRLQSSGGVGATALTVATGFTNNGAIELTNINGGGFFATLTVTAGTLTNAAGATITSLATGGGSRTLAAELNNQGTLTVQQALTLARSSAAHANSGTLAVSGGDLTITQSGATPSFTTTGTVTIASGRTLSVTSGTMTYSGGSIGGAGTWALSGVTLHLTQSFSNGVTALVPASTTINGPGTLTNAAGQTLTLAGVTINAPLHNEGLLLLVPGTIAMNGAVTTATTSTIRLQSSGGVGATALTVATGFTNNGAIELTNVNGGGFFATLTVTAGTLTNAAGGTITSLATGGGARSLAMELNNQGTLTVEQATTLARSSAAHANSGTIAVSGGDLTITQSGATPSFTTTGTVTIASGRTLSVTSGTMTYSGGSIGGAGTWALSGVTLHLTQSFSNGVTALVPASTTINGPGTLTNAAGQTLTLAGVTINAPLQNEGLLVVPSSTAAVNGALTTATTSTIRVQSGGGVGATALTVATGFTNNGAIELTNVNGGGFSATLTVTAGTLTNAAGATITSLATGGGSRTLAAELNNQGTLTVQQALTLARSSVAHANSGTIAVSGGDLTITQSGATPSFTTTGTVTIASGRTLSVTSGTMTYSGGSIGGAGTWALSGVTLHLTQSFSNGVTALVPASTTINGPGTLTNAAGQTLTLAGVTINAPLHNEGLLVVPSSTAAVNGALTTATTSTIRVQSGGGVGATALTVATGFTNNGAIELTNINGGGFFATLTVTAGTLTNAAGGTITSLATGGGARSLAMELNNQGTLTVEQATTLARSSAAHANSGTIAVSGGDLTITQSGATPSFTTTGTVTIASGRTLSVTSGTMTYSGGSIGGAGTWALSGVTLHLTQSFSNGVTALMPASTTINGPGTLTNAAGQTLMLAGVTINAPLHNEGLLVVPSSTAAVNGALTTATTSTIRVQSGGGVGATALTVATGFTNNGAIELTNVNGGGFSATLTVTAGTLTNAAGATITSLATGGGSRTLAAELNNQGTLTVQQALTLARSSVAHANSGTIAVSGGDLTITQSGATPSFTTTGTVTIASGRTLSVTSGTMTYSGGSIGGAGTWALSGVTLHLTQSFSNGVTALVPASTTINGPGTLTNAAGQTLTLAGVTINAPLQNEGLLVVPSSTAAVNGALTTATTSTIRVQSSGGVGSTALTVATGFTNNGAIELTNVNGGGFSATLTVTTGTLTNAASGTITSLATGGGNRTINAQVNNQGTLNLTPGAGGSLTIAGSLTTTGTLNLEIGGTGAGSTYDQLAVTGNLTLGGTLNVSLVNAFTPANGQIFTMLTSTLARTGTFGTVSLPPGTSVQYNANSVTVTVP